MTLEVFLYIADVHIKNIGNSVAIKPEGHPLFKLYYRPPIGETKEYHYVKNEEYVLEPDEEYRLAFMKLITSRGAKYIVVVDPDNVVDEGVNGEENNEGSITLSRAKHLSIQNNRAKSYPVKPTLTMLRNKIANNNLIIGLFERFPNLFPMLRYILGPQ